MKSYKEICAIIHNMDQKIWEALIDAWYDMITNENARKDFLCNIKKSDLTEEEFFEWINH